MVKAPISKPEIDGLLKRSWFKVVRRENTPLWESLIQAGGALSAVDIGFENPMKELLALDYDKYAATDDFVKLKINFIEACKKDPHFLTAFFSHLEKECRELDVFMKEHASADWGTLSDVELRKAYESFVNHSLRILTFLWPPLAPEEWIIERISKEVSKSMNPVEDSTAYQSAIHTLIESAKPSLFQEREEAIAELAAHIGSLNRMRGFAPEIEALHKKYSWINDHSLKFESETREHFEADIQAAFENEPVVRWKRIIADREKRKRERAALIHKLDLPEDIMKYIEQASHLPHWRFLRTEKSVEAAHHLRGMFDEIGKRMGIENVLLCYYWEVSDFLEGNPINTKKVLARKNGYGLIIMGDKAFDLDVPSRKSLRSAIEATIEHGKVIKGNIACKGLVKGKARVLTSTKDLSTFKEGEVLVTAMTTPEYVSIMKKAAAIVTDEGGISCHAAIVSRELKVPCVIGTKNATKILKTGDMVEVDANAGLVRKLS